MSSTADRQSDSLHGAGLRRLILFVADREPNSERARQNLERICQRWPPERCSIEVVDVLEDSREALEFRVLVTPSLVLVSEESSVVIAGTLNDDDLVKAALGVHGL